MLRTTAALTMALITTAFAASAHADAPLTICINEDAPPYSVAHEETGSGFDVAVAQAVARHLNRPLVIQWFETRIEEDSSSTLDANALLSDGHCDLLAGYPLIKDKLGKPGFETARLPDFRGAKPADRRRRVVMGTLIASQPYHRVPLVVVLGPSSAQHQVKSLADLDGLKIGVQGGTLADAILMTYSDGRYVDQITHFPPGAGPFLARLERGEFDATLVLLHQFDVYRGEHPDTRLTVGQYTYPTAFNMGYVALSTQADLVREVNSALADMLAKNQLEPLAKETGMSYVAPREPAVLEALTFGNLQH